MFCVEPGRVEGVFDAPPSKPYSQRLLLAAALAEGETLIKGVEWSDDFVAMYRAVQPLAEVLSKGRVVYVKRREPDLHRAFNVAESGFTLRTAVAVYAGIPGHTAVYYGGTLRGRPIDELVEVLKKFTKIERAPGAVFIEGRRLGPFEVEIRADVSSQYISGLMYLAAAAGEGTVRPLGVKKSWSFVEATAEVLRKFGAEVKLGDAVEVRGGLKSPGEVEAPGDFSLAAFLIAAAVATGGWAEVRGRASGVDRMALEIFKEMGAYVEEEEGAVRAGGAFKRGVEVDLGHNPDLVMPVALAAAMTEDETVIKGVEHLRYKESDRIATVIDVLRRMGAEAEYKDGALKIRGPPKRRNVLFSSHGDHRIGLMALAAAKAVGGCIDDVSPIAKSWPTALLHFRNL
jgi:3-phosphoshikimate 1-carboxyvinyltransferase (EC 2.5.1.19)